jgi:hypothetical protein
VCHGKDPPSLLPRRPGQAKRRGVTPHNEAHPRTPLTPRWGSHSLPPAAGASQGSNRCDQPPACGIGPMAELEVLWLMTPNAPDVEELVAGLLNRPAWHGRAACRAWVPRCSSRSQVRPRTQPRLSEGCDVRAECLSARRDSCKRASPTARCFNLASCADRYSEE